MLLKRYILLPFFLVLFSNCFAQNNNLPVRITLDKNKPGDSLWLTVAINNYAKISSLMFTAALENDAVRDTFFIPVIDSVAQYCLVFPDSIRDNLTLQAYFFPDVFRISGQVNRRKRSTPVKAILITENEKIYNKEISFLADNKFKLPALIFEKQASLVFNYVDDNKWKSHPDISFAVSPTAADFKELVFSAEIKRLDKNADDQTSAVNLKDSLKKTGNSDARFKTLKDVEITGTKKSKIQKFNEEYSTGLFNDPSEKVIDCLNNNDILSYPNCISYLQGRTAGLTVNYNEEGEMVIKWRGSEMKAFFIDEIPVDMDQILTVNPAEIAMIKVYPPPFFGSSNGDGGAIALYTRHGEYSTPGTADNQWLFTLKGYVAPVSVLFKHN